MSGDQETEKPPVFRSWAGWYWTVLLIMVVQLLIYCWITFSY